MRFLEHIRYYSFWILDFLKGSKIRKNLNDIASILEANNPMESQTITNKHLERLLQHAVTTTPYYKKMKPDNGLASFPVINKNVINKNPAHFQSSLFKHTKNKTVTTSGSTGALLTILQDQNKIDRNIADNFYFSNKAGFKIGTKLYYLRHWSSYFKKNKWLLRFQNIYPVEVVGLSNEIIENLLKEIKRDHSKKAWLGYASGFESICQYLDSIASKPIDAHFQSIIAISEHLSAQTRQRMSYYFKTPVVSRYSNMENGILAQQPVNQTEHYVINWASYHVEILDLEQDIPVSFGKRGRIVVTDLFNYGMPLIRYDTGDLGVMEIVDKIPVLKRIEGRASDIIYNTKGALVSSFMIIDACNFKGIHQIQFIQQSQDVYTIKLNASKVFSQQKELISNFISYLGTDAKIDIVYVKEIPLLRSGKRKIAINKHQS
jgi:phenylacetate-CoA ligase